VWIERFLGWEAYNNILISKANAIGLLQLPVEWRKLDRRPNAKTQRIGTPLSWMTDKKLYLFAGMKDYEKLVAQLKKWPKIPHHDDYGDCLGHACEVPHGAAGIPAPQGSYNSMDYIRQLHAANLERQSANNPGGSGTGTGLVSG
jgi:hypothetical protein